MNSEHVKIFTANSILTSRLKQLLENANIPVLIKDRVESGRLGGFGVPYNSVEVFVFVKDLEKATEIVKKYEESLSE